VGIPVGNYRQQNSDGGQVDIMATITAKQIQGFVKGDPKRHPIGSGLYLVVRSSSTPYWMLRYTSNGKRKEMTLGQYPNISLADAKADAAIKKQEVSRGTDPLLVRKLIKTQSIKLVDNLYDDWFMNDIVERVKSSHIQKRIYTKDIKPVIGDLPIEQVTPLQIRGIIQTIRKTRPTVANDALGHLKQIFSHGIKLNLLTYNPAREFTISDAGGIEKSRERNLTIDEVKQVFGVFKQNITKFNRDNYLACALLITLGVRKSELCCAPWSEFELEKALWHLPESRSKTGVPITIPLPLQTIQWLNELKIRACGSDYVFPARRKSKKPHMGNDTLNRAISSLFGHEAGRKIQPENLMGDIKPFSPHDLRRTFRSLTPVLGIPNDIAEHCLNHKQKNKRGVYDRYEYIEQRREAHTKIADYLDRIINE
jgi:integrase|tara:strand:- start:19859 stop:21133 length:1275 start_codon:yes stop_codon:yes gene_type:complete